MGMDMIDLDRLFGEKLIYIGKSLCVIFRSTS